MHFGIKLLKLTKKLETMKRSMLAKNLKRFSKCNFPIFTNPQAPRINDEPRTPGSMMGTPSRRSTQRMRKSFNFWRRLSIARSVRFPTCIRSFCRCPEDCTHRSEWRPTPRVPPRRQSRGAPADDGRSQAIGSCFSAGRVTRNLLREGSGCDAQQLAGLTFGGSWQLSR